MLGFREYRGCIKGGINFLVTFNVIMMLFVDLVRKYVQLFKRFSAGDREDRSFYFTLSN
jgi:hypothetical protein